MNVAFWNSNFQDFQNKFQGVEFPLVMTSALSDCHLSSFTNFVSPYQFQRYEKRTELSLTSHDKHEVQAWTVHKRKRRQFAVVDLCFCFGLWSLFTSRIANLLWTCFQISKGAHEPGSGSLQLQVTKCRTFATRFWFTWSVQVFRTAQANWKYKLKVCSRRTAIWTFRFTAKKHPVTMATCASLERFVFVCVRWVRCLAHPFSVMRMKRRTSGVCSSNSRA